MNRIYLIIFLVLVVGFIYWYQKNVKHVRLKRKSSLKSKKSSKKNKRVRFADTETEDTEGQIFTNDEYDDEDTDSRIRPNRMKCNRAYEGGNNGGRGMNMDDTEDSEFDTESDDDMGGKGRHRGGSKRRHSNHDDESLDSLSMEGSSESTNVSLESASSSDFLSRG